MGLFEVIKPIGRKTVDGHPYDTFRVELAKTVGLEAKRPQKICFHCAYFLKNHNMQFNICNEIARAVAQNKTSAIVW